LSKQLIK